MISWHELPVPPAPGAVAPCWRRSCAPPGRIPPVSPTRARRCRYQRLPSEASRRARRGGRRRRPAGPFVRDPRNSCANRAAASARVPFAVRPSPQPPGAARSKRLQEARDRLLPRAPSAVRAVCVGEPAAAGSGRPHELAPALWASIRGQIHLLHSAKGFPFASRGRLISEQLAVLVAGFRQPRGGQGRRKK